VAFLAFPPQVKESNPPREGVERRGSLTARFLPFPPSEHHESGYTVAGTFPGSTAAAGKHTPQFSLLFPLRSQIGHLASYSTKTLPRLRSFPHRDFLFRVIFEAGSSPIPTSSQDARGTVPASYPLIPPRRDPARRAAVVLPPVPTPPAKPGTLVSLAAAF